MSDAAACAIPNQVTPSGYYNIERMLKSFLNKNGKVKICGTCADAGGIGFVIRNKEGAGAPLCLLFLLRHLNNHVRRNRGRDTITDCRY